MATKTPIQSKNLWFNGLSVLALVITDLMANDAVRDMLGAKIFYLMIAGSVVNMGIRFFTEKPIKITLPTRKPKSNLDILEDENQSDDNYGINNLKD